MGRSVAGLAVVGLVAACGTNSPSAPPGVARTPTPPISGAPVTTSPSALPEIAGSASTTVGFHIIRTEVCTPSQVPNAQPVPSSRPSVRPGFVLHVPVLMYHRIVPNDVAEAKSTLIVPPEIFSQQLGALSQAGWKTITLARLADDLEAGREPGPKTFVITIDDGWDDGYTYGFPILQQYGYVATYFVIASRINEPNFLTVEHLRTLVTAGMEVGNHTLNHVLLDNGTPAGLRLEIAGASATIAEATGRWPETLAYPSGQYDPAAERDVSACQGLKMAVIEGDATYESWATRFAIPRVKVHPGTSPATLLSWVEHPWPPGRSPLPVKTTSP